MCENKCPFCNKPLHCGATLKSDEYLVELYQCANPECESTEFLVGCKEFWDILGQHRRTHKALEIAVDVLKYENKCIKGGCINWETEIDKALAEITALEQKEHFADVSKKIEQKDGK